MNNNLFPLGLAVTLLAGLITFGNSARAEAPAPEPTGEIGIIGGSVSRATFTTAVVNREPRDRVTLINADHGHIYYFTELKGMAGQTVTHRWVYDNDVKAEVSFTPGAARWRVWSNKTLLPQWQGEWTVQVVNDLGQIIHSDTFSYHK